MPNPPQKKKVRGLGKKTQLGTAPNTKAAAARMNLTAEMLKAAMEAGCDAFQANGKVQMDRLAEWLAENPEFVRKWSDDGGIPPKGVSQAISAHFDALDKKRRHEKEIKKLIDRSTFASIVQRVGEKQRAILKAYVSTEVLAKICAEMKPLFDECQTKK